MEINHELEVIGMVSRKSSESFFPTEWFFKNVVVNGKAGIIPCNLDGQIINEKKFHEMIEKATLFYDSHKDDQGKMDKFNSYISFNNDRNVIHSFPKLELGKTFELPEAIVKFKGFKPNLKRKWSCKCALCGKKVSSDKDDGYFLLDFVSILIIMVKKLRMIGLVSGEHVILNVQRYFGNLYLKSGLKEIVIKNFSY